MIYILIFALVYCTALTSSSPLRTVHIPPSITPSLSRRDWNVDDLNNEFKGIRWDFILQPDNCSPDQRDILIFATRYAMKMLELPDTTSNFYASAAWKRYFGDYVNWLSFGAEVKAQSEAIAHNIRQAQMYPKTGGKDPRKAIKRVWYSCKQFAANVNCNGGAQAITYHPSITEHRRWEILFCPVFFTNPKNRYLERISDGPKKQNTEIAFLDSYERLIAHEYMHVDVFGYKEHIADLKATIDGHHGRVYGDSRCAEFALQRLPRPNSDVVLNADNYAWFFAYYWFSNLWGWTGDIDHPSKRDADPQCGALCTPAEALPDDTIQDSFPVDENDVEPSVDAPQNCQWLPNADMPGGEMIHCDPIREEYSEWVKHLAEPFASDGNCELSPECHKALGYGVSPGCTCSCDGLTTDLKDARCSGYAGTVPMFTLDPQNGRRHIPSFLSRLF